MAKRPEAVLIMILEECCRVGELIVLVLDYVNRPAYLRGEGPAPLPSRSHPRQGTPLDPGLVEMQGHLLSGSGLFGAGWQAYDGRPATALLSWMEYNDNFFVIVSSYAVLNPFVQKTESGLSPQPKFLFFNDVSHPYGTNAA